MAWRPVHLYKQAMCKYFVEYRLYDDSLRQNQ